MIHYTHGDASDPRTRPCILAHICNDAGKWGKGFVLAVGRRYPEARRAYLAGMPHRLGNVQFVPTPSGVVVANMIAQHGIKWEAGVPPIRYEALTACLDQIGAYAAQGNLSVHMPRIGAGLAGGEWTRIEHLITQVLCERHGLAVAVYNLPSPTQQALP
jgi:O-acetyl-ADP-ribose deacetylase (regulator of RNase III)